eukprot:scaffold56776_cov66-Phaeocystis_antarctica.AAC.2
MWEWVRECADEARRQRWQGQGERRPPHTPRAADRCRRTAHGKQGGRSPSRAAFRSQSRVTVSDFSFEDLAVFRV